MFSALFLVSSLALATPTRVVVIPRGNIDHTTTRLQRRIRRLLDASELAFFPAVDLYQKGRLGPHWEAEPDGPPAVTVPEDAAVRVEGALTELRAGSEEGRTPEDWAERGAAVLALEQELWFLDRPELRAPLFDVYAEAARCALHAGEAWPPDVRAPAQSAAALAADTPALLGRVLDPDARAAIAAAVEAPVPGCILDFSTNGTFDPEGYTRSYTTRVNGIEVAIADPGGRLALPQGRADVLLARFDPLSPTGMGPSLSWRDRDVCHDSEHALSVFWVAGARLGQDLAFHLREDPSAPLATGDIVGSLWIYEQLYPAERVVIALPVDRETSRQRVLLWQLQSGRPELLAR